MQSFESHRELLHSGRNFFQSPYLYLVYDVYVDKNHMDVSSNLTVLRGCLHKL